MFRKDDFFKLNLQMFADGEGEEGEAKEEIQEEESEAEEKTSIEEILKQQLDSLDKKFDDKLEKATEPYKNRIKELEETIESVIKAKGGKDEEDDKQDERDILSDILNKREQKRKEQQDSQQSEEVTRVLEENRILKLQNKISNFLKENPYVETILQEKVEEGTIKNEADIERVFNPSLLKTLKEADEYKKFAKKLGADPRNGYEVSEEVTEDIAKKKRQESWKEKFDKIF